MALIAMLVVVDVDEAQHRKLNERRGQAGRARRLALDEVENAVVEALQHNAIFSQVRVAPPTLAGILELYKQTLDQLVAEAT